MLSNPTPTSTDSGEYVFSVSELNQSVKTCLERNYGRIWLVGEISNLSQPSSGHLYFALKDQQAQVRCAFFKSRQFGLGCTPENGMQILISGKLSLYPERGDYQIIVESIQEYGQGQLQQQYEALKRKLEQAGLFAAERKRPIPTFPMHIAIITSPTGAALQDVLSVLQRRCPLIEVQVYPSAVQGAEAPGQLMRAIQQANYTNQCDAILLTRGGGAIEDLWAFNDEQLAHCIASSRIPIVSAVGHEIDFTIADFAADYRAPTPSAGAECLSPDQDELLSRIEQIQQKLIQLMQYRLKHAENELTAKSSKILHPRDKLQQQAQHIDFQQQRLLQLIHSQLQSYLYRYQSMSQRLSRAKLDHMLAQYDLKIREYQRRIYSSTQQQLATHQHTVQQYAQRLHDISPLTVLSRGYAVAQKSDQSICHSIEQLKRQETIQLRLQDGYADCEVKNCYKLKEIQQK